jgi:1-acyl-sn-glycerol-3-phosphate acyltransferase
MKGKMPIITIFPEGTLNNGETIMKFKKGGFAHSYPIRIRCSKWFKDGQLTPSFANMNVFSFMLLALSCPGFDIEFFEIEENIDPLFFLQKYKVNPEDPEAWTIIAKEIKQIMQFMTNM